MQILAWNFAGSTGKILFYFVQIAVFRKGRQLDKVMAKIMPGLSGFLNGRAKILISCLLQGKEMILLHKPCVFVQAVCYQQKHGVEEYQDHQKNQADHNISLKDPSGVQGVPVLWHHEQIQRNEDQRQDPEDIPGLCEIFIVHHSPCCMGSRIPCSCKKEQADSIIEKSCACSEPQFIFRKVKPCSENGVECPGQTVDAGEHRAHSQENTAGFPDGDPKSPVVDSHNCRQQKNQHRQGGNLQSIT